MNSCALARRAASSTSASRRVVAAVRDVVAHRSVEQEHVLLHDRQQSRDRSRSRKSRMSMPLRSIRPRVGSWNRATRSVTVVLPAPLRPTSATTDPPGTVTLKSRTTGRPSRYSNSTSSNRDLLDERGAVAASGPVRLVVGHPEHLEHPLHRRQRSLQLGERVHDVPHRPHQQHRVPLERHDVADRGAARRRSGSRRTRR